MGTMAAFSGRGERAVGVIVRFVESDEELRRVTTSGGVWAIAGRSDRREESKKRAPQDGGLFLKTGAYLFRSAKQGQSQRRNYTRRLPALSRILNLTCRPEIMGSAYREL